MPGRYYFAPVQGVAGGNMEALAYGLERGVQGYQQGRERQRQDQEAERQRLREEREDAWRVAQQDLDLARMGGGRGRAPGSQDVFETSGIGLAAGGRQPSPLVAQGGVDLTPKEGVFERMNRESGGRRYVQAGDFYIEDPESRATRIAAGQAEAARAVRAREADETRGRISAALTGNRTDPANAAALIEAGVAGYDDLFPEPFDPATDPAHRRRMLEIDRLEDAGYYERTTPADRSTPTYDQALDNLRQLYPQPRYEDDPMPPDPATLHDIATRQSRGEEVRFPELVTERTPRPGLRGAIARKLPGGSSGYDETRRYEVPGRSEGGGGRQPLSDTDKQQARSNEAFRRWLEQKGYTEADWRR